jgi:hypothetical protein
MTHIWYEVFPVTLVEKRVMLLQQATRPPCSPWMLPHQSNIHPNAVVVNYLSTILGPFAFHEKTIVHSTSWRYDALHDWMLLTYLAILPQTNWQAQLSSARHLTLEPIGDLSLQYNDRLMPPEQIERQHVLAHALDHLASLETYDPVIQATLEKEWREILRSRQPKPAGCLQRTPVLPAPSAPPTRRTALLQG